MRKTEPLHYYPWHYRDFRANRKVQRMCWQSRGLYRELLDEYWDVGSLPNDQAELADVCGCTVEEFTQYWPQIRACFPAVDGRLTNPKMDAQRTLRDKERVVAALHGSLGGKARAENAKRRLENEVVSQPPLESNQATLEKSQGWLEPCKLEEKRREEKSIEREEKRTELNSGNESPSPSEESGNEAQCEPPVEKEDQAPSPAEEPVRDKRSQDAIDLAKKLLHLSGWDTFTEDDVDTAGVKLYELLGQQDAPFLDGCIAWATQEKYWQVKLRGATYPGAYFTSHFPAILKQFIPYLRSTKRNTLDDPNTPYAGLLRLMRGEQPESEN